jgi:hypothetical protein
MGTFTIPLKKVIDLTGGTVTLDPDTGISTLVGGNIGLGYYPIFDPAYKEGLTGKIVDHYWNREIATETIEMFQMSMRRKMNEIMPYYNLLYESTKILYDPLSTVDLTTVTSGNTTDHSETTNNQTADTSGRTVSSETPQTMLSGNSDYATNATDSNSQHTANGDNSADSLQEADVNSNTKGFQGIASDLIVRYRESLLNIDVMVINELEECFMLVWDNGDEYMDNGNFLYYGYYGYYGSMIGW